MAKDCDAAQEKANRLRESNCELEAKLGEERKKLRDANLTIHRLQLRLNSLEASRSRGNMSEPERRSESVSSTYEPRDDDEPTRGGESRRTVFDNSNESRGSSDNQPPYRDRFSSRDSPVDSHRLLHRRDSRDRISSFCRARSRRREKSR